MATVVTNTIGVGGDYSTAQSWEDAAPPNLVTVDQVWVGELVSSFTHAVSTPFVTFSGTTCDATRYKELTVQSGLSFQDNPSKLTNALAYVPANGLYLDATGITDNENLFSIYDRYVRINRLQVNYGSGLQGGVCRDQSQTYTNIVEDLIVQYFGNNIIFRDITVEDTIIVVVGKAAEGIFYSGNPASMKADNITAVRGDGGSVSNGVFFGYAGFNVRWSAFFGFTNLQAGGTGNTFSECASSSSSPPSGVSSLPYDTTTGSGFYSITSPYDFRIRDTSALVDAATNGMAHDIVGTLRPQGGAYDIGCWEYSTGGGGSVDHATDGDVEGNTANVVGTARRFLLHTTSGDVVDSTDATVTGQAELINAVYLHETEGVLTGQLGTVAGTARRFRTHTSNGIVIGDPWAIVEGLAEIVSPPGEHETYGALSGQHGTVVGTAKHLRKHVTSGNVVDSTDATVEGEAVKFAEHDSSGIIVGYDTKVVGQATNVGSLTLTPADIAAIVAALKAEILPVNIVRVNYVEIDGTGTGNDPWGPV